MAERTLPNEVYYKSQDFAKSVPMAYDEDGSTVDMARLRNAIKADLATRYGRSPSRIEVEFERPDYFEGEIESTIAVAVEWHDSKFEPKQSFEKIKIFD